MQQVEVQVKGYLDEHWSELLDGLALTHTEEDETVLTGVIPDQAALHGLIAKLRDLGVTLVSVSFRDLASGEQTGCPE